MHMVSRKDLNSAELETVRVFRSPTTVVTANGEVQTKEEATVYVRELGFFVTTTLLEDTLAVLSLGKLCEDHGYNWTGGQKPHLIKNGRKINCNTANCVPFVFPGLSTSSSSSSSPTSPTSSSRETVTRTEYPASTRSEIISAEVGNSSHDLPEWPEDFNVDESVPEHRDASSSSHELLSEPRAKVVSGKHSIFIHFPKDRNCDICLRTKITRKRTGTGGAESGKFW